MSSSQSPCFNFNKLYLSVSVITVISLVIVLLSISSITWSVDDNSPKFFSVQVLNEFPHDPQAFTEGLLYAGNDTLFESTGLYGKSSVRRVALQTGKVEALKNMDESDFGEGLTLLGEKLFQLTWSTQTGFIYDQNKLSKIEEFTHQMQDGWGLATDGKVLFGSDGTSILYHIDPQTFKVIEKHIVKYNGYEVRYLNELEFINGEVWANVLPTDCIARISPGDGTVLGWVLLHNIRNSSTAAEHHGSDILNGIAWDSQDNRIFVTGKLWPKLYQIKLNLLKRQLNAGAIQQLCSLSSHSQDLALPGLGLRQMKGRF